MSWLEDFVELVDDFIEGLSQIVRELWELVVESISRWFRSIRDWVEEKARKLVRSGAFLVLRVRGVEASLHRVDTDMVDATDDTALATHVRKAIRGPALKTHRVNLAESERQQLERELGGRELIQVIEPS